MHDEVILDGTVTLSADLARDMTVTGDSYLDLGGFTLTGNLTGDGTLHLVDTTGDAYELPAGRVTGTVSCDLETTFKANTKRYLVIADETGYTSHRIYVGMTHMNLQPATNGVGYKAVFAGDSAVQAMLAETDAFGFTLWVGNEEKQTFTKGAAAFESGKTVTLRLQNFDAEGYGEVPVYGQVFMKLADGTVIESAEYSYTLRQLMETVAASASSFTAAQLSALSAMIQANPVMKNWDIDSLYQ